MSQKVTALFQEPQSFENVQFQAQEIFNFYLILEFEVKLLSTHFTRTNVFQSTFMLWLTEKY